ncbi:MAG: uroporphyrinogen decarboxylase family protein [Spirochaetia bacterium]|jgi:uroporphyrinogen decarboxylase
MTPRERILAAIDHREPDRVPVDLGSTPSSGISGIAYARLKIHLGETRGHNRVYDVVQQLAQPEDFILDRFAIDVVDIGRTFNTADSDWYNVELADGSKAQYPAWFHPVLQSDGSWEASVGGRVIAKMPPEGTFFDQTYFPYIDGYPDSFENLSEEMGKILWAALVHSPWDHISEPDFWQTLRSRTQQLRGSTDSALMIVVGCNLFEWGSFLRRLDNFLMDLVADQYNVERLLDALMEQHLSFLDKVCTAVGDLVDIARFGDDLGMDQGPFMPPEIYEKLFKPRHAKLCDFVKKHSRMHTFIHTCGSIYELLPHIIEAGFEIINPVQTNARNMEPAKLKAEFGKDLTFWGGGVDTRQVLNRATPREVKEHVKRRLEIFAPGGGFVFNTVHNILPDVPPENIVAMFEAVA